MTHAARLPFLPWVQLPCSSGPNLNARTAVRSPDTPGSVPSVISKPSQRSSQATIFMEHLLCARYLLSILPRRQKRLPQLGRGRARLGAQDHPLHPHLAPVGWGPSSLPAPPICQISAQLSPYPGSSTSHSALLPLIPFPSHLLSQPQLFPPLLPWDTLSPSSPRLLRGRVRACCSQLCSCVKMGLVVLQTPGV